MPLQVRAPVAEPEPADREHVRSLAERSITTHTQWNAGYEQRSVDLIADAVAALLSDIDDVELPAETWNLRSEGMRAVLNDIDARLAFTTADGSSRYRRENFQMVR